MTDMDFRCRVPEIRCQSCLSPPHAILANGQPFWRYHHETNPGIPRIDCVCGHEARRADGTEAATHVARPSAWPCRAPSLRRSRTLRPALSDQPDPSPKAQILEPDRHTLCGLGFGHRHIEQIPPASRTQPVKPLTAAEITAKLLPNLDQDIQLPPAT